MVVDSSVGRQSPVAAQVSRSIELYGPWMVATSRRRRPAMGNGNGKPAAGSSEKTLGTGFAVLQEELFGDAMVMDTGNEVGDTQVQTLADVNTGVNGDEVAVVSNIANNGTMTTVYQESNPGHRSKRSGNKGLPTDDIEVISLIPEGDVVVDSHKVGSSSGHHRAIHISETVGIGKKVSRVKETSASSSRGKGVKDSNNKGLRIKKGVEFHPPSRVLLTEWVNSAMNRIQATADNLRGRTAQDNAMEEDGRESDSPRDCLPTHQEVADDMIDHV
ncbi:hypothetical protein V6N13_037415 [Hibiscus sabdariffa]